MIIKSRGNSDRGVYDGFSTALLLGESNTGSKEISIQITDVDVGKMQFIHSHEEEQCYYIITGLGTVIIDDEERDLLPGDAVFIPSGSEHGIKNRGDSTLTYLTANRPFGLKREAEIWPQKAD